MPWSVIEEPGSAFVEVIYSGEISSTEIAASVLALLRRFGDRTHVRMLTDLRSMAGGHSIVDLYVLVDEIHRNGVAGRIREAVLLPAVPATAELAGFWETACTNRGIEVRLFTERDLATAWLVEAAAGPTDSPVDRPKPLG